MHKIQCTIICVKTHQQLVQNFTQSILEEFVNTNRKLIMIPQLVTVDIDK